jgi:uncharacterized protein (TIGR04255 family)
VTTLSQAPLIEVATQVRWGVAERNEEGEVTGYNFTTKEVEDLPKSLSQALIRAGYSNVDEFAREFEDVKFAPARRYRSPSGESPTIQTGLGVFSVHEVNERYEWKTYRESVLRGFDILSEVLIGFYGQDVPFVGAELLYVDAYFFEEGETPATFLKRKLKLQLSPPREFRDAPFISPEVSSAAVAFQMHLTEPEGVIDLSLAHVDIAGRPGYIMDTRVRSTGEAIAYTRRGFGEWLESAHRVQQHAFRTLIHPTYLKSFE